jgi:magnesium chelatase family protein
VLARVRSGATIGIDAVVVDVEVDMTLGLPYFNLVGLPDGAVKESKVRVISALKNCGFDLPQKRITVNLAPADLRKEGAAFELPIALGILWASRFLEEAPRDVYVFGGELALDGVLKPIHGVLPLAVAARKAGFKAVMVPTANAAEAALVGDLDVYAVSHLREAVDHLKGDAPLSPYDRRNALSHTPAPASPLDMSDVRGQHDVKIALEIAAAGGHNILMCGPPGSGKTMLARRLPGILPPMAFEESVEVTKIYSVLGMIHPNHSLVTERPFRSPHHTISDAGLIGGGAQTRPGELSMAHHGVLFLDELPEFRRNVLEVLRQPLEDGSIHLARANQNIVYPCQLMLVAAMNPCRCGYFNVPGYTCKCQYRRVLDYHTRVSGPLLDRIDINLQTRPVEYKHIIANEAHERTSAYYRERVEVARERQRHRFRNERKVACNAQMSPAQQRRYCVLGSTTREMLGTAVRKFGLSARAHDRIMKLARTRADLEGHERIEEVDMALAIDCRVMDRKGWLNANGAFAGHARDRIMDEIEKFRPF